MIQPTAPGQCRRPCKRAPRELKAKLRGRPSEPNFQEVPDNMWDEKFFPRATRDDVPAHIWGEQVLAQPKRFLQWAASQDATLVNKYPPTFTPEEWQKQQEYHTGAVRHGPRNKYFVNTCEFWAPISEACRIIYNRSGLVQDRAVLIDWMRRKLSVDGAVVTDQLCFTVLKVTIGGEDRYFYRSSEEMKAYKVYSDKAWQEERQYKKSPYVQGKGRGWCGTKADAPGDGGWDGHRDQWHSSGSSDPWATWNAQGKGKTQQ